MTIPDPEHFEKLATFYLGRQYDLSAEKPLDQLLMYDAKDLCTHAMCVGMTGSGKTGLCLSLLEEAAIDGIPAICVDPKGDLANLLLTFPDLAPGDFQPWLDERDAERKGESLETLAEQTAQKWREGLASWGQQPERIRTLKEAVDVAIYTPGSTIGLPLTVLKNFDAPGAEELDDLEAVGERVTGAVSGLLTLLGVQADPLTSPEHILLSSILMHQWQAGKNVGIANLIRLIQSPPMKRVGVVDLDSFMSPDQRSRLAMRLNNLLASPAFAPWLEGERLSISKLLYTDEGKPRVSILSIAHLSDDERMFFLTILLNELVAWMRKQSGTNSLRALFYMDEVAGYFPPVSMPPSKPPMLTLLKQARAFGLGITLATQNPVDLDYKGLSNIGTWFLGRLQTERDKARVLEGLEGAAGESGQDFDRGEMEQILAGLQSRVFLMNNVHEDAPVIFQTRWALSYLAGPLARQQISDLMAERKEASRAVQREQGESMVEEPKAAQRGAVPSGIEEQFLVPSRRADRGSKLVYRPALLGRGSMHFIRASADLDRWTDTMRLMKCGGGVPDDLWQSSVEFSPDAEFFDEPEAEFEFSDLPDLMRGKAKYRTFKARLKDYLYRHCSMTLYQCRGLKGYAPGGSTRGEARIYFQQLLREKRDVETEKLRENYRSKRSSIDKKIRSAEDRIEREASQASGAWWSVGSSILGSFLGGRRGSVATTARGVGRASQQQEDVRRARRAFDSLQREIEDLEDKLKDDLVELAEACDIDNIVLETTEISPRKSDLKISDVAVVWTPWQLGDDGIATPLFDAA